MEGTLCGAGCNLGCQPASEPSRWQLIFCKPNSQEPGFTPKIPKTGHVCCNWAPLQKPRRGCCCPWFSLRGETSEAAMNSPRAVPQGDQASRQCQEDMTLWRSRHSFDCPGWLLGGLELKKHWYSVLRTCLKKGGTVSTSAGPIRGIVDRCLDHDRGRRIDRKSRLTSRIGRLTQRL